MSLGLTRQAIYRWVGRRRLIRLHVGVYAVGHVALSAAARDLAAVLACGPDALLSHRSAANRWGLLRTSSPRIEVTAPRSRTPRTGIIVHRSRTLHDEDREEVDGIPVTSVARTIVDVADVVRIRHLEVAVNEAELRGLFDMGAIERALERLPNRPGRGRLSRVLAAYRPDPAFTRSNGEREVRRLCADNDMPAPHANLWIEGHEVDLWWPDAQVAIEFDGGAVHQTTRAFHEDRRRDRALAARGIAVVRVTSEDLRDPAALARELKAIRRTRLAARHRAPGRVP